MRLLPRCINLLFETNTFSKSTLLETLSMSRVDAEDILSLPRGYLADKPLLDINSKIKLKNSLTSVVKEDEKSNVIDLFTRKS